MVTTRRQAYEAKVLTKVQDLQLRYFRTLCLELHNPIPVHPTFHRMTYEEVEEEDDDYYQMLRFHYMVTIRGKYGGSSGRGDRPPPPPPRNDETHWREGHMQSLPQLKMTNFAFPSSHVDYGRSMARISYPYAIILVLWLFMDHMLLSLTRSLTCGEGDGVNEGYSKGGIGGGSIVGRVGGGDNGGNREKEEICGYNQPPPSVAASYGSGAERNYQPLSNSYEGNNNFVTGTVPPPTRYTGGPNFYPPSYGGSPSYSGDGGSSNMKGSGERGQHDGGYGGAQNIRGGYGGTPPSNSPVKVKQCDESCGDSCDNSTCLSM
ncbi:hypothetical protein GIB67_029498 [Kingdonia uniflora]|uniref:Uncharacterized protein n=1 Tax=Kingdonia uniflora TaxID=39325 RepID=A0A7J7NYA9_9MAGN|nr:hypothetical protein GIB67_029498 [Kingdonia uniflora]